MSNKFIINIANCLATLFLCLMPYIARAQYRAVQLCNESRKLDGGARLSIGDISRSYFRLTIPKRTAAVIYSIATNDSVDAATIGLLSQINTLMPRYKNNLTNITDSIKNPRGNAPVNIFIADAANEVSKFMTYNDDSWNYKAAVYQVAARTSYIDQELLKVPTIFLCISNMLERQKVSIHIEAVALVAE